MCSRVDCNRLYDSTVEIIVITALYFFEMREHMGDRSEKSTPRSPEAMHISTFSICFSYSRFDDGFISHIFLIIYVFTSLKPLALKHISKVSLYTLNVNRDIW